MAGINITKYSGGGTAPLNFQVGDVVQLAGTPTGEPSYFWEWLDRPEGSAAAFTSATSRTPRFTIDVAGTYFVQLTVAGTSVARAIAAAPYLVAAPISTLRPPAAGETMEESLVYGWARAIQKLYKYVVNLALSFLGLSDTPDSYTGQSGKYVRVKGTEDGLEFVTLSLSGGGKFATGNKEMSASLTTADFQQACATAIAATPLSGGYVAVAVNGMLVTVGDGVKTKACYFSADGGITAKSYAGIVAGDTLYWVGSAAGYQLATTDKIDFLYTV